MKFFDWLSKKNSNEKIVEFQQYTTQPPKWSMGKEDIMKFWRNLNPSVPITMKAMPNVHKGSTYGEDGIRITGSPEFIASVLSKLKSVLEYESPNVKLNVSYRETQSPSQLEKGNLKKSYVFYVQAKQRG